MLLKNIQHKPLKHYSDLHAHEFAEKLLNRMTTKEKIGQLYQAPYYSDTVTGHAFDASSTIEEIKMGMVGSLLSVHDEGTLFDLQKVAVEQSRLHIPLIFMFDVIHGYKTAFPINLALSNTWEPNLIYRIAKAIAYETAHAGIHVTFSPMVDLVRDPKWGRVMESNGEDPYLSSELTKAYVSGYQGDSLSNKNAVAACVKHFAGYGFVEAGREYNTVDVSKRKLFTMILPPFRAAVSQNVALTMTAFNTLFDRPATANKYLLKDILRNELGFNGIIISDYTSTEEIISHKVAKDEKDAAKQCFDAGLEHEMVSRTYLNHLQSLLEAGEIDYSALDEAVLRMLMLKYKLGLFDDPYRNLYTNSKQYMLLENTKKLAVEAVEKSVVMLKNDKLLPLSKHEKIGLVGPFIDSKDLIGEWAALCEKSDVVSIKSAFEENHFPFKHFEETAFEDLKNDNEVKTVIVALGESGAHAGEGNSKTNLHLDTHQQNLLKSIKQMDKKVVLIVFAGRPLILTNLINNADAVLYAYQPGTMAGIGLFNLITGKTSPSGKLTMTFPFHEGQVPIYYNHLKTGRPFDEKRPTYRYNSRYIDAPNEPLYPFGYGLSYGVFIYTNLRIDKQNLHPNEQLNVQVTIQNDSIYAAEEVVQLYIESEYYSVSRPVDELKAFKRIKFNPHETKQVDFVLTMNDFRSYNMNMIWTAEISKYQIKVGPSSSEKLSQSIEIKDF